jgi:plastocyanin
METTHRGFFSRQPLSAFGNITIAALLGGAASSGILALTIGYPDNMALLIVTACQLLAAGLVVTGFRWMPPLVVLLSSIFFYQVFNEPFVSYHLANPKAGGFFPFVLDILIIACALVTLGASIGATVQNYRQGKRQAPRWLSSALTGIAGVVIGAILIAAIGQTSAPTGTTYTNGVPTVHMSAGNFSQPSVTIPKGSTLLLVDDVAVLHILSTGSWENGVPKSAIEPGAPTVNNVQVNGKSVEVGPFTTAGTYHIYCTIHQGMNLTVIVQ